jgi:16S rRNA (cytosine967-C5)-methyltransferase
VNPLRTERDHLLAELAHAGIQARAGEHPQAIRLDDSVPIRELPGYAEGWFSVQDESAMQVASALSPPPGSRVLDLCAAPGSKTTHLAELMHNEGEIIACDVDARRLGVLTDSCRRLGLTIVQVREREAPGSEPPPGPFDAVLVDVPCSNTGVLGRRPEVRWRLHFSEMNRLVPLQIELLLRGAQLLRPGGAIVYSTCSIEPEENRQVVDQVCRLQPDVVLESEREQVPGRPADGGYWARLRRRG